MLEEPKNPENDDIGEPCYPVKVAGTVPISLGMLSTNMEPNHLGLTSVIESRTEALACLELSGFAKITQNQLF